MHDLVRRESRLLVKEFHETRNTYFMLKKNKKKTLDSQCILPDFPRQYNVVSVVFERTHDFDIALQCQGLLGKVFVSSLCVSF